MEQRYLPEEDKLLTGPPLAPSPISPVPIAANQADVVTLEGATLSREAETAETIGAALSREARQHQKSSRRGIWGIVGVVALLTGVSILARNILGREYWSEIVLAPGFQLFFALLWLSIVTFLLYSTFRPRSRRRRAARTLATQKDVRSVGALIDCQKLDDPKLHQIAYDALIPLLSRLEADDAALLNAEQRARLNHILSLPLENALFKDIQQAFGPSTGRRVEIRVAILKALAQVGDSKSLPIVTRLANQEAKTAGQQRVRAAAQECLPALQERVAAARSSETLLRPSQASDAAPDTLLRAATGTAGGTRPDDFDQLLRAGEAEP